MTLTPAPSPTPTERAAAGAAMLDALLPTWVKRVDPDKIDLYSHTHCVLGQVYGSYSTGLARTQPHLFSRGDVVDRGFIALDNHDVPYLQRAWAEAVRQRQDQS